MILYLDANAFVKLYADEPDSDRVLEAVEDATTVAVSVLVLPETLSAISRKGREGALTPESVQSAFENILGDWPDLERFDVNDHIAKEAASLARSKGLTGADAVHLATVAWLSRERRGVRLLAFDAALNQAAKGVVKLWGA